jgi:hypothetical protein
MGLMVNAAGDVEHVHGTWEKGPPLKFPASLPTANQPCTLLSGGPLMSGNTGWATSRFLLTVELVLMFAYPGKFACRDGLLPDVPFLASLLSPDELLDFDHEVNGELKAAVRALKANMHFPFLSLAELAYDCLVVNDMAAALEGMELPQASRPPEL